tara:strand:+ start:1527 stop:1631 length:105 start_codon:yes stop_codon:yes gene_type:complete
MTRSCSHFKLAVKQQQKRPAEAGRFSIRYLTLYV